jgi:hypothetical protein
MRRAYGILLVAAVLGGCPTYSAKPYASSAENVAALRTLDTKINVGPFTSVQPDLGEMTCGTVGPITTPDGETYGVFIRKALVDELKSAAAFSERAPITLTAILNEIEASSTAGTWNLSLTVNSSNGRSLTVKEQYTFTPSWNTYTACQQTAQALVPSVQALIGRLVQHPDFKRLIH